MGDRVTTAARVDPVGQVIDLPVWVACFGRTMSCPTTGYASKIRTAFAHIDLSLINAQMSPVRARRKPLIRNAYHAMRVTIR